MDWRDQEMWTTPLKTETEAFSLGTIWQQISMSATAPVGTSKPVFHGRVTFKAASGNTVEIDSVVLGESGGSADTEPPTPNPMTWTSPPSATSNSSVAMTASVASDASGVEYYFECVSGACNNSGWQNSWSYTDIGLLPNSSYGYQAQARDKSTAQNATDPSSTASATTPGGSCTATNMHIQSVVVSTAGAGRGAKRGRARATVSDDCGATTAGVTVHGDFSGGFSESRSASTKTSGVATIETRATKKGGVSFTFCVTNVTGGSLLYSAPNPQICPST